MERVSRVTIDEQTHCSRTDTIICWHIPEIFPFVLQIEAFDGLVIFWNFVNVQAMSNGSPEIEQAEVSLLAHGLPAIMCVPPDWFEKENGEHIQEIFVGDGESPMQPVHALDSTRPGRWCILIPTIRRSGYPFLRPCRNSPVRSRSLEILGTQKVRRPSPSHASYQREIRNRSTERHSAHGSFLNQAA